MDDLRKAGMVECRELIQRELDLWLDGYVFDTPAAAAYDEAFRRILSIIDSKIAAEFGQAEDPTNG